MHPLAGRHKGHYAIDLHGRWRLIVSIDNETIRIEEVSNHYGD